MEPIIEMAPRAEDNAFALMLAQLIRQNIDDHTPKKGAFLRMEGRVAIVVEDLGQSVTLSFERGRLTVHDGIHGIPDVTVRAGSDEITKMSLVELASPLGLPDPRGAGTRAMVEASRAGKIRVWGAFTNLSLVLRLTRVMSVNGNA